MTKIHVLCVIVSRPALNRLSEAYPDVSFTAGTVDDTLGDDGTVLPGLGDAGDRLFGTAPTAAAEGYEEEDGELLHPSKRRKMSDA